MKKYGLKMNPLKCAFGVSAGKFLGFIIHEDGIEIDPKKIEAVQKVEAPTCKRDMQKFLGKVNYLRRCQDQIFGVLISQKRPLCSPAPGLLLADETPTCYRNSKQIKNM